MRRSVVVSISKATLGLALLAVLAFIASTGAPPLRAQGSSGDPNVFYIADPSFNMNAVAVTIPPKWHGQGVLYGAGACGRTPYFVFRATSPDGLSYVERLPAFNWTWGSGPAALKNTKDCFPVNGPMSAKEFLKYLAATMNVEYVSDAPVPDNLIALLKKTQDDANLQNASSLFHTKKTMEAAHAIIRSKNGTFAMKGLLETVVDCDFNTYPGSKSMVRGMADMPDSLVHFCTANVRYTVAPEAQFAAVRLPWEGDALGGKLQQPWLQAWQQRTQQQMQQQAQQQMAQSAQNARQFSAQMQAQHDQFNHDQAVRQQMHQQFLATMQRGTDMSMARTQQNMNARSTAASDWVDYALDQKTVADPNTGQISKVSNAYTHTWVDSTGRTSYQTNDSSANPNGVLPGNWVQQDTTHGDGTPR